MKSISLFVDNGTYLTKVHPFTKLMYIAAAISIPLISGRLWMFGVFIAVSLLVLASGKILKKTLPLIAFSFTILLTIFLIHGLFNQKNVNVLFQVVGLKFYREGIFIDCRRSWKYRCYVFFWWRFYWLRLPFLLGRDWLHRRKRYRESGRSDFKPGLFF